VRVKIRQFKDLKVAPKELEPFIGKWPRRWSVLISKIGQAYPQTEAMVKPRLRGPDTRPIIEVNAVTLIRQEYSRVWLANEMEDARPSDIEWPRPRASEPEGMRVIGASREEKNTCASN
jgi:hypothetical protein